MLNRSDNELLTRIGPGTAMGDMLREYWVPACRTASVEPDGAPFRVRLFGEDFVAFRVTDGRVGFMQEACPHRCASMALARNEANGLRCIFHGWKFDVDGKCVDAPTEPQGQRKKFTESVPVRSHPVHEAGGIVWVYLGKKEAPPPFPDYEFTHLAGDHVQPMRGIIRTNWLQGLEALLDSAHVGFLHSTNLDSAPGRDLFGAESDYILNDGAPVFEFDERPYGFREGAIREEGEGKHYARVREVALPFFSYIPAARNLLLDPGGRCHHRAMVYLIRYREPARREHNGPARQMVGRSRSFQRRYGRPVRQLGAGPRGHETGPLERLRQSQQRL